MPPRDYKFVKTTRNLIVNFIKVKHKQSGHHTENEGGGSHPSEREWLLRGPESHGRGSSRLRQLNPAIEVVLKELLYTPDSFIPKLQES